MGGIAIPCEFEKRLYQILLSMSLISSVHCVPEGFLGSGFVEHTTWDTILGNCNRGNQYSTKQAVGCL